jgi:hypothetical protein
MPSTEKMSDLYILPRASLIERIETAQKRNFFLEQSNRKLKNFIRLYLRSEVKKRDQQIYFLKRRLSQYEQITEENEIAPEDYYDDN